MPSRRLLVVLSSIALAFGCSDTDQPVVSLEPEPAGANCHTGGQAIHTGIDRNGNGALDPDEVAGTRYVCNGAEGLATLFAAIDEPAGANCPHGGKALRHGLDLDRDGQLAAEEISGTEYVCNGAPGVGLNSLVSVMAEAAGTNCAAGGQAIRSGVDEDADGMLQPGEVDSTAYVCNGTSGLTSLVRQEDELPGAHCLHGGRSVMTGLDADGDAYLDDTEVAATSFVCNGSDGAPAHASLVLMETAAPGADCAAGGFLVRYGQDLNDDGALDESEDSVRYLCHGGEVALRVTNSVWGGVCARGGVKVETGLDANADGLLGDSEVERTQYVCNLFVTQLAAGRSHTCALLSDGSARCWGANAASSLGDGTFVNRPTPVAVNGLSSASLLAAGSAHNCALLSDGTARCWGWNAFGQLGDGTTVDRQTPVAVSGLTSAVGLVAGGQHTCALLSDGSASCWGMNGPGVLGDGTNIDRSTPVAVSGLTSATSLDTNTFHSCARLSDGSARCWGSNGFGALGDGTTSSRLTAVEVVGLDYASSLAVGEHHTCARLTNGTARCWGRNVHGQLGDNTTTNRSTPTVVDGLSLATSLVAGMEHTCALLVSGRARCWGANSLGQLGDGTSWDRLTHVEVSGLSTATALVAGARHTCALLTDGSARCWGENSLGQLGDGTTTHRLNSVPVVLGAGL